MTVIVHELSLSHKGNCLKKVPSPEIENKLFQQKKSKQVRFWGHTFLKKILKFLDLSLYPWKFSREKTKLCPWIYMYIYIQKLQDRSITKQKFILHFPKVILKDKQKTNEGFINYCENAAYYNTTCSLSIKKK